MSNYINILEPEKGLSDDSDLISIDITNRYEKFSEVLDEILFLLYRDVDDFDGKYEKNSIMAGGASLGYFRDWFRLYFLYVNQGDLRSKNFHLKICSFNSKILKKDIYSFIKYFFNLCIYKENENFALNNLKITVSSEIFKIYISELNEIEYNFYLYEDSLLKINEKIQEKI